MCISGPCGVTATTLDSESSDRGSNPREAFQNDIIETVVPRGLEPRTLRLLAVRSNQLSYETVGGVVRQNYLCIEGTTVAWCGERASSEKSKRVQGAPDAAGADQMPRTDAESVRLESGSFPVGAQRLVDAPGIGQEMD